MCPREGSRAPHVLLISPISPQAKMPFDANKLYCSEVLAILLQDNDGEAPSQY